LLGGRFIACTGRSGRSSGRAIGEWLWDDEYGYGDFLRGQKKNQTTRNWSALFQQSPAPDTGDFFKADWIRTVDKLPESDAAACFAARPHKEAELEILLPVNSPFVQASAHEILASLTGGPQ
jgi:hypothetical protein